MAESGGNPNAVSSTADYGLWQINASHGAQATFDPLANAEAAVSISSNGTNWNPWTTFVTGAYSGRC
ncbi:MAG TPA: transglycosylase SLT domain-containing protein [Streptosporangiaceae bacterium]|jgi:soluble lytic murein transglycosylase-like protein|nr:transglycosylase SLT domain-containing protein [Streptosporangiaceae bacterium]